MKISLLVFSLAYAFAYNALTSVTLPESLVDISFWTFAHNDLTDIIIPRNVVWIGSDAFCYNPRLAFVCVEAPRAGIQISAKAFGPRALVEFAQRCVP